LEDDGGKLVQAEEKMTNTFTDHDAIIRTVQMYVDGGKSGKSAEMKARVSPGGDNFWLHRSRSFRWANPDAF